MGTSAVIRTHSPDETRRAAAALADLLRPSDVVALQGDLGSGKTCFVEAAARALGYSGRVRSPSFTLLNIYRARMTIHHLDLYRWSDTDQEGLAEWDELMDGEGVTFIEWADRLGRDLPDRAIVIRFAYAGEVDRELTFHVPDEREAALIQRLTEPNP